MLKGFRGLSLWQQWLWVSAIGATSLELLFKRVGMQSGDIDASCLIVVFIGQWLLLRGRIRGAAWWPLASALFGVIGSAMGGVYGGRLQDLIDGVPISPEGIAAVGPGRTPIGYYAAVLLAGALLGLGVGFGQWLVLRLTLRQTGWWILAMVAGFMVGSFLEIPVLAGGIASSLVLKWLWEANHPEARSHSTVQPHTTIDWWLFVQWVWLTTLGFGVGETVNNDILGFSHPQSAESMRNVLAWFGGGACVGAAQWYLLRQHIAAAWRWVLATAAGWALGILLIGPLTATFEGLLAGVLTLFGNAERFPFASLDHPLNGAVAGVLIGVLQWFLLRRFLSGSGWWVLASTGGWALSYVATDGKGPVSLGPSLTFGVITGSLAGVSFVWLLRRHTRGMAEQGVEQMKPQVDNATV